MPSQFKNIEIQDTGYLTLPSGTSSERPASPESGMIRYNTDLGETEWYDSDDSEWKSLSDTFPRATGGTVVDTEINGRPYRLHYFTETGTDTLTVTAGGKVDYLIVAGGGGGGGGGNATYHGGGGGGAGGLIYSTSQTLAATTFSVTVGTGGSGGSGGSNNGSPGSNGNNSVFNSQTAIGGGGGGGGKADNPGNGGSGGGEGGGGTDGAAGGTGTAGQGNNGGRWINRGGHGGDPYGGGGGGAGAVGGDVQDLAAGNGGSGTSNFITGSSVTYAGGGGGGDAENGGNYADNGGGTGGFGGGGAGGSTNNRSSGPGANGVPNTGGGGGGGQGGTPQYVGGDGGSGIVIVRYPRDPDASYPAPDRTIPSTLPGNFNVIQDGLVFNVDPSSPITYTGSGGVKDQVSGSSGSFLSGSNFLDENQGVFEFDGNNKGIDFGTGEVRDNLNRPSTELTVCAYFKTGAKSDQVLINNISYDNSHGWQIRTDSSDFIQIEIPGHQPDGTKLITDNQWHFVGITFKTDGQTKYYIDGVLEDTFSSPSSAIPNNTSVGVYIGGMDERSRNWNGLIGPVWVYEKELSSQEIRHNFNVTRGRFGI